MKLTIQLTGIKPMLQKNGRLADPLDAWTLQLKELTSKRQKTESDLGQIYRTEARGSVYETADGNLGLPTQNVWRSIKDAATAFKRGKDIERGLIYDGEAIEPLLVAGQMVNVNDYLADDDNIFRKVVVVQRARTVRCRPIVRHWSTVHQFDLFEDVITPRDLIPILERAGRLVGIGDWRPIYGTYQAEVQENA